MEVKADNKNFLRAILLLLISLLFIPAFHFCAGQIYYQRAQILISQQTYSPAAIGLLQKAEKWLPWDSSIQYSLGIVYLDLAQRTEGLIQELHYSIAVGYFKKAEQLNPLEPEIIVSVAYALEAQEKSSPDTILAAYQRAADLAPHAVQYVALLADKLWQFGRIDKLPALAETLGRIYPDSYYGIRLKSWWGPAIEERFRRGLLQAIEQDNDVRRARIVLAYIMAARQDWLSAAEQQRLALLLGDQRDNSSKEYFQLAKYYLHSKNLAAAYEVLLTGATKEESASACIGRLLPLFQQTNQLAALPDFYQQLRSQLSYSYVEDVQLAELLIQSKQDEFAVELLNRVIAERDYLPKPWLLLAEIYRHQKRTADMEAALSKAKIRMQPGERRRAFEHL
jgi:tetratricopeptide (TPR) repeat protein